MNSDLTADFGPLDPGLDRLFRTLTAPPAPGELAGEQAALTMFRANVRPPANPALAPPPAPARERRRRGTTWGLRLAAAMLACCGALAGAAYASALPDPVQRLAHDVFQFAGVPPVHHGGPGSAPASPQGSSPARRRGSTPAHGSPRSSASPPAASASPSATPAAGAGQLSAVAASARIAAGTEAVIDGQLTRSGASVSGVTVTLVERLAGRLAWSVAGSGQTNANGNVAIGVSDLSSSAVFRLIGPGAHSPAVRVTVIPQVTASLTVGTSGLQDVLVVTAKYAEAGNVVVLQVESAAGTWSSLREKTLTAAGTCRFVLSGTRQQNRTVRVVLRATVRHGAAISNTVTVPPPS